MIAIEIVLLAITRMRSGFCFAGMTVKGQWVRPVLPVGQWSSLIHSNGTFISIGDIIRFTGRARPAPPHTEDIVVHRFEKVGKLTHGQLIDFLSRVVENEMDLLDVLNGNNRSLCVISASFRTVYTENDPRQTRIAFRFSGGDFEYINNTKRPGFPCVCLHWRAIQGQGLEIPQRYQKIFIAIGLSRRALFPDGRRINPSPMIISIITDPPLPGGINYLNP